MTTHAEPNAYKGLTWEGKSVEIADIERELNRLWQSNISTAQGRQMPVRASVLNLVVYTTSDADADKLGEMVGRLSGRHPLRAVILSAEPYHAQPSLDTRINSYCFEDPETGSQVCCEQVIVGANGEPANHLTGIVVPLLIPDLPVYLWWMGEPQYESETFTDLIRSAQKLIIDSATFTPTPEAFRQVLAISRSERRTCAVSDLNWMRLWPWLEVVAQFFDHQNLHPHLYGIQSVVVEYAKGSEGEQASPTQAALMAAWLFSRLGEQPDHLQMKPVAAPQIPSGNIASFTMETRHGAETARFVVDQLEDTGLHAKACAQVGERKMLERVVAITPRSRSEMLDIALEGCSRDLPYEDSLEIAAELLKREAAR